MADCIFCKIVKGEIPSEKVYEDKKFFTFLDIHPTSKGHTVVSSKEHFDNIFDSDEKLISDLGKTLKKVSVLLREKYKCEGVNLINNSGKVAGQEVSHFHFHVIPRYADDKLNLTFVKEK